jgi:hypothetical protein
VCEENEKTMKKKSDVMERWQLKEVVREDATSQQESERVKEEMNE